MPGVLLPRAGRRPGESRPLVVLNNGSDGADVAACGLQGGAAASDRGYHWMTFDGPGQQATLFDQGLPFRPDWEAVLTPVVDAMPPATTSTPTASRSIGVSQAGYWVPRALAFEHRFAAAVADPGVVDVSTSWIEPPPELMRKLLEDGQAGRRSTSDMGWRAVLSVDAGISLPGEPYGLDATRPTSSTRR